MEYISAWEQEYIKIATSTEIIEKRLRQIDNVEQLYNNAHDILDRVQAGDNMINEKMYFITFEGALERLNSVTEELNNLSTQGADIGEVSERVQEAQDLFDRVSNGEEILITEQIKPTTITLEEARIQLADATYLRESERKNKPYTHCELDPQAIFAVATALIPYPDHNQAPRNTYQVGMGKQALGVFHTNHLNRFDGKTKILSFPSRPMVETEMYDIIGLSERGPGENVTVAFMAYPFTEEDAFIFKKEFLDNGGFRMYKYLTYKTEIKHVGEIYERLMKPPGITDDQENRYKYIQMADPNSPLNGLPMIGAPLRQGDCIIGKMQYEKGMPPKNISIILRVGDEGIVERVLVTNDGKNTTVTVKLRIMRVPVEGDKFAPRNAQKGTIGLVMSDINMPVSESGIVPDIIVNPHSLPSRMTVSYPLELLASKYGAMAGTHINGGAFKQFELNKYRAMLKEYGMDEFGYETMRSGTSGKLLEASIFMGPVFFQALKHHVKDKIQARSTGQVKPISRQPPKGRGKHIASVVSKITASLYYRRLHIQIQGKSC